MEYDFMAWHLVKHTRKIYLIMVQGRDKLIVCCSSNFVLSCVTEGLLPCSQKPAIGPPTEPV